ncbi:2-dehydropantoate 2-reductase [Litchfieldia alkalitelluris]|uniref:2-dehydropantoate 2-reductase n=1 Tax=Litchfieldia alkalitelluris TaxID=304268 RepID=UPI000996058E|nr:2-dehydropantoate 2-reductase [Litchfieldia alkalitelluris]
MKIGIVGGGSIGLLFGYYLASEHEVIIHTRTKEQANNITQYGITIDDKGKKETRMVKAATLNSKIDFHDALIIAVKQYDLEMIMNDSVVIFQNNPMLLFLQNGMSHLKFLEQLDNELIGIGIVEHGAMKISSNSVKHTGKGLTRICAFKGEVEPLLSLFSGTGMKGLQVIEEHNLLNSMHKKLVINSVINPLTALFQVENGKLLSNPFYLEIMKDLFEEVISVIPVREETWNHLLLICENTSNNRSSMLKDIDLHKATEIDSILGYVLEQANQQHKTLKLTKFLYSAIKGLEKRR